MSTISIVIATYNRVDLLDECLAHIARQRFERGDEVIVVDNGSNDHTAALLTRLEAGFPVPLRSAIEPRPGKSHALARGVAMAAGDILAFTDDDVNVSDGWLDAIRAAMTDPSVALIGGPVEPRWQQPAPAWLEFGPGTYDRLAAPLALLDYGPEATSLGPRTVIGANLAVRREVIARVGGFSRQLGKLRGTLLSGEDHELCQRVQSAGYTTLYCPAVKVTHWVPAARTRLRYFLAWFFWSGITHAALDGTPRREERAVFRVPLYLVRRFAGGLVGAIAAVGKGDRRRALEHIIDVAFASGYAAARLGIRSAAPRQPIRAT